MNLLVTWNPLTWLSDGVGKVAGAILHAIRTLLFSIDIVIYKLIIQAYNIFNVLCRSRLLENDVISKISQRVSLLLGLLMFLSVCFSFIQVILEPDKLTDKEVGAVALIKKCLIVIILLGTSSWIFSTLFELQKNVIESNVISKLLIPYEVKINDEKDAISKFGNVLSLELLTAFYEIPDNIEYAESSTTHESESGETHGGASGSFDEEEEEENNVTTTTTTEDAKSKVATCKMVIEGMKNQIYSEGRFDLGYFCLNETVTEVTGLKGDSNYEKKETFLVEFNGLLSIIAGIIAAFLILSYCTKLAMRMLQIAVLEVIAPLAFISYLAPKKDGMLSKWAKLYFATYVDVFIRVAIINFGVFIIEALFATQTSGVTNFWNSADMAGLAGPARLLLKVIMILAILAFMRKAPETLKDLLPGSGSGLGFGASLKEMGEYFAPAGRVVGAGVGMAANGAVGFMDRYRMAKSLGLGAGKVKKNLLTGEDIIDPKTGKPKLTTGKGRAILAGLSGLGGGFRRGLTGGLRKGNMIENFQKSFSAQHEADTKYEELIASGGTGTGSLLSKITSVVGGETKGQAYQRVLGNYSKISEYMDRGDKILSSISSVRNAYEAAEKATQYEWETLDEFIRRKRDYTDLADSLRDAAALAKDGDKSYKHKKVKMEEYITESGRKIMRIARKANGDIDFTDEEEDIAFTSKDITRSADYRGVLTESQSFINSRSIKDTDGNQITMKEPASREQLDALTKRAEKSRVDIVHTQDYAESIANDTAAGVKPRGNSSGQQPPKK